MYWFLKAAVTNCHKLVGLKQHKLIFLWLKKSEARTCLDMLKSRCQQACIPSGGCLHPRPLPPPSRLATCIFIPVPLSHLHLHRQSRVSLTPTLHFSFKDAVITSSPLDNPEPSPYLKVSLLATLISSVALTFPGHVRQHVHRCVRSLGEGAAFCHQRATASNRNASQVVLTELSSLPQPLPRQLPF